MRSRTAHTRCTFRRGMTLLEVVLAVLLLGLTAAALATTVSTVLASEGRSRERIAAAEVAHRLILTWLDDDRKLPSRSSTIEYGPYLFYYDLDEKPVRMNLSRQQRANERTTAIGNDRFVMAAITMFEAIPTGDGGARRGGEILSISRVIDPFAGRNPDEMARRVKDPERLQEMINRAVNAGRGGG